MNKEFSNINEQEITEFYKKVSQNVRNLRESKGISQLDLALEIGIKSVAFYSNCENNRYGKHFNLEHIYKISKALNISICEILEDII
ncbi:helix-turn-helix domain-containing protein [Campylobacter sp. JMF_01 NE2]|uniref:helix-turn-helix domain-containing protein n=1 Tax=unclassified Campylobacter TaxID=2593542 RepID=UPI0022E9DC2F|nr:MULTISPECIES: helix-turn-helix transcriptional regulator [unclassified Campylobacter]MDA3052254.1 helix-turn-helix domain-containing protein [Campylobacter sp. JMF_03 NE3]MDA3066588.1 helix-turn-helix domain-containing protein [Campylobacter sp. JMF_01 NE2]MDA3078590.1 helix-turn-helix domain-containing protein [Campylobacter sp. JMF_06 NA1]